MMIYLLKCESGNDFSSDTYSHTINAFYLKEEADEAKEVFEKEYKEVELLESYLGESESLNRCISYELCKLTGTLWSRWFMWYGMWSLYTVVEIELI